MDIITARQMQELDRKTIQEAGISGAVLMENAGRGTFEQMLRHFPDIRQRRVIVLAGKGNNGGDGFVIARYLLNNAVPVKVFLLARADTVSGDAAANLRALQNMGGTVVEIPEETAWQKAHPDILHAGIIVDAIFGTGLSSAVTGLARRVIEDVNRAGKPVVAVDLPSGVDATSGALLGSAVRAHLTCTFGLAKQGLVLYPGASCAGKIEVIDIGIPQALVTAAGLQNHLLEEKNFRGKLPRRNPDSHKGTYGHAFVIAGSSGKTGAAAMAAQAAMRVGAGLVTIGVPAALNQILAIKVTEAMTEPLPDSGTGFLNIDAWPRIQDVLPGKTVIAVGPGISDREETAALVFKIIESAGKPLVIDADGLNAVSRNPEILKKATAPVVLTPHPGEMARLTGTTTQAVQADRIAAARKFSSDFGVTLVLKGSRTVIAEPSGHVYINPTGNPGMASGGMGDVLTGMIAGFIAQGFDAFFSAQLAVFMHGRCGDQLAVKRGSVGILATDICDEIPATLHEFIAPAPSGY
jgi:ADP-dependent NAD(P)H-hydrate dehydratase / NAD(P)H-hydrate epimerase